MKDFYHDIFSDVGRVLVVAAHPDDFEVMCGATVARLLEDGKKVRLVVTTNGEKGVKDKEGVSEEALISQRGSEQQLGARAIGIADEENFNLGIPDGELEATVENIGRIVYHIRQFKPDCIITHNPHDVLVAHPASPIINVNHRDHRHTGLITIDAAYPYSRDNNFFPEQLVAGLTRHEVHKLLFSDSFGNTSAIRINVDNCIEKKKQGLAAHASQFNQEDIPRIIDHFLKESDGYYETFGYAQIR